MLVVKASCNDSRLDLNNTFDFQTIICSVHLLFFKAYLAKYRLISKHILKIVVNKKIIIKKATYIKQFQFFYFFFIFVSTL